MPKRLALLVIFAACGTSDAPPGGDGTISGSIGADTTWAGALQLKGFVTIEPGVTVTVDPGANITVATGASIDVEGTLAVAGEKGNVATIASAPGEFWLGVQVAGTYTMSYGVQSGGSIITMAPGASVTVTDSELSAALGDFLIMNGGSMDVEFSNVGLASGDHTHCNMHVNEAASITFTHNVNRGVPYGLMLYAGTGANFTHNNWIGNVYDVEPQPAGTGSFNESYFEKGIPPGVTGSTFDNLASAPLADVGPR